jgi:hypothetical protein
VPSFQRVAGRATLSGPRVRLSLRSVFDTCSSCVSLCAALACDASISRLDPATGHDRTLVVAVASPALHGTFFWDPGPSERSRAGGLLGQMFTVPGGAAVGTHSVLRYVGEVRGSPATFKVDEVRSFPRPRIDRVSLVATEFKNDGSAVATLLYVQGANVDVGAAIELKTSGAWTAMTAMAHQGIANRGWDEVFKLPYRGLDYPIYHHLAFVAIPGDRPAGDVLSIRIQNEDGTLSDPVDYKLPLAETALDSDGDGLPDQMEPTLLEKHRPDIFLEIDHMVDAAKPLQHPWSSDIGHALQEVFAAAPVINPIGPNGINLVIDDGQTIPQNVEVWFEGREDLAVTVGACTAANIPDTDVSMRTLKRACFDNSARGQYWHYCVWAGQTYFVDAAGSKQEKGGFGEIVGDDCVVGADYFVDAWMVDARTEAEILMHELGHNLGLRHGGYDDAAYNPTYNSVMSMSWLGRNHWATPANRKGRPICTALYYQMAGAVEVGGTVPSGANPNLLRGYSDGMGRTLRESDLDEKAETTGAAYGVCNSPVDWECKLEGYVWTCDDDMTAVNFARDLNESATTTDALSDHPDWSRIVFNGPALNGTYTLASDPP